MGARRVVLLLVLILAVPTPAIGDTTKPKTSESNCASGSVTTARTSPRGLTVESRSKSACQLGGTVTQWRTMTAFERADELELGLLGSNLPCSGVSRNISDPTRISTYDTCAHRTSVGEGKRL